MRWVPTIAVALAPLGCVLGMVSRVRENSALGWAGILPTFCMTIVAFLTVVQPRPLNGTLQQPLDEREITLRLRANVCGLALSALIAFVGCGYMSFAAEFDWWSPTGKDDWNGLFWTFGCWMFGMPLAFANWQSPTPLDEEDDQ